MDRLCSLSLNAKGWVSEQQSQQNAAVTTHRACDPVKFWTPTHT